MAEHPQPRLARDLSLLDIMAFGITGIIGQGIFLLPGFAAGMMGPASIVALILAGVICLLIALCFAEAGSRYSTTGAAYLYARDAFGNFVGFQVGWLSSLVSAVSWASLAIGFTAVLSHFIPDVGHGWVQKAVAVGVMGVFTIVNLMGVRVGALVNTLLTVAKLIPIAIVIGAGLFFIDGANFQPWAPSGYAPLADTTLFLLYAYVGFEVLAVPAGEMKHPQRSVPLALISVLLAVIVIYLLVMLVAVGTLPDLAGDRNPVANAARAFMGSVGGTMVAVGICLSVFGTTAAMAVFGPRRLFAMAERGDLPGVFASVHARTKVPTITVVVFFLASAVFAVTGTFKELIVLGVVARFAQYIPTALAVLVFRHRDGEHAKPRFRIPFGPIIPIATLGLCTWLLMNARTTQLERGGMALLIGIPLYVLSTYAKRRASRPEAGK